MSASTPILAIACGPSVTTWDIAKSTTAQGSSLFHAKSLAGTGKGVEQFQPYDGNDHNVVVSDLAWNHNGQVIVSCSNSLDQNSHNVVLTHYATKSKLESFSNFQSNPPGVKGVNVAVEADAATSISFGGKAAKSRYLCVSDTSGAASVWDMKKISRVRCFKMKHMSNTTATTTTTNNTNTTASNMGRPSCIKSCMDPSDTHVVALHGSSPSCPMHHIAVELFHLKSGSRIALLNTEEYQYGGGADCFEFSDVNNGTLLVGARDGSLLLWDVSISGIKSSGINTNGNNAPMKVLEQRHSAAITDVAFSPMNKVLAASCSMDGKVGFHDIHSQQTIQTVTPWDGRNTSNNSGNSGAGGGRSNAGLTSFAFHHDGYTWAVGTEAGMVFTYDLRQTGQGPLCTMDLTSSSSSSITYPVKTLQFVQMKSATTSTLTGINSSGIKPAVKKTVSLAEDGAVTVEREKNTPSRKEISKTTYSIQKEDPPPVSASASGASTMTDGTSPSKRTERVVKRTTTTRKVFTSSSSPQRISGSGGSGSGSSNLTSPDAEPNVERTTTSTSEFTTSSPQRPSTTKRVTKTKVTTSSPQRSSAGTGTSSSFASPPLSNLTKDLFAKDKKDMSVSFDNRVKRHAPLVDDLTFGEDDGSKSDSSEEEADQMMEDFDAMYERIKSRALTKSDKSASATKLEYTENASTHTIDEEEDDDSGDDSNLTRPTKLIDNETVGPPEIVREVSMMNAMKYDEEGDNPLITLRKSEFQDMIDEAADSLRDDVEESIQALQVDFLRQMQRQSDEVAAMLARNQREMQLLSIKNQELTKENERLRKLF